VHNGAPAHFSRSVLDILSNTYHDRWTGREGPTAWPPSSPDLNNLDFYIWGHLRTLVYATRVDNEEALHRRIVDACQTIRNCPGIFERMRRSMRRVEACIGSHRGHFENLLYTLSAVTHKLNSFGDMLLWTLFLVLVRETRAQVLSRNFSYTLYMAA
jgi:hypothetical protein